ncbi:MAG: fumarate/nitrate reduction transcriptional regulator Fnr [Gammaproteobacteria bacterium]
MDTSTRQPLTPPTINPLGLKQACSSCSLRELCLPIGLEAADMDRLDRLVTKRKQLRRGEHVFRVGAPFQFLFAIRTGFFKTYELHEDGQEHISGFHMAGEIIGMDAISTDHNTCNAVALEDSELCEIPFPQLETLCREIPALQHQFHKLMSREIIRDHGTIMLLGGMRAEERLAAFLLNLSQRYAARGYSATQFHLRMTRAEIGHYLGMKLETVSRTLTKFQDQGLITVDNKYVELLDPARLRLLMNRDECAR